MSKMNYQEPHIDPKLDELLDLLRQTPKRDPKAIERGRAKYLSEVDQMFAPQANSFTSWLASLLAINRNKNERNSITMNRTTKLSYSILLVAVAFAVILFSGAGVTAYAAQSALPGDALYGIKTSIEQTQVRLAADAAKIAELHLEFAERRLDEISGLIAEGRYEDIDRATQEFEHHVQQALSAMQTVASGDPVRAKELASRVTAALSEYARALSGMLMNVPENTRSSMQRAIITSQNADGFAPGDFGENANENANDNLNGVDENVNDDNDNLNANDLNENGNENENQNGDDNENLNSNANDNENDDDHNNNSNLNDNQNDRDDDNNQNDSGNDNGNDGNGGDDGGNDNGGDSGNDNGGGD